MSEHPDDRSDRDDIHTPTPDFRASLERELVQSYRRQTRFGAIEEHRGKIGMMVGIAAGAVFTLTVGLLLGASTGYASAETIVRARGDQPLPPSTSLAVLKNIPPLIFSCSAPVTAAALPAQRVEQGVPVVDLPPATSRTSATMSRILGVRQLSNGKLLVDDAGKHQLTLFDSTLASGIVVRDSVPGTSTSYGPKPVPLIRYTGDSSLLVDENAGTMLVLNPNGQVAHVMAPMHEDLLLGFAVDFGGIDPHGRFAFTSFLRDLERTLDNAYTRPESSMVVRVDPETRRVDTLARLKTFPGSMMLRRNGGPLRFTAEPVPMLDEWAMTSDGSIGVVRGADYHIDWIRSDGTAHSTGKLPFDWKRLTDEEKQRLIDSTRDAESPKMSQLAAQRRPVAASGDGGMGRGGRGGAPAGSVVQGPPAPVEYVPPALKDMPDYYPPIRYHALLPDLDGNLWILPTSSAQSKNGELVYDVVNEKGAFRRVRIPAGRSVIGFGRGGVVYLQSGDLTNGFVVERSQLSLR